MHLYFCENTPIKLKTTMLIGERIQRQHLLDSFNMAQIVPGDIITVVFWKESIVYRFEGILLAIRKFSLLRADTVIILRNIIT